MKAGSVSIVVYRVVVDADGSIQQSEKISGHSDLQAVADTLVSGWHFKKADIRGSASSWWCYIGVCFFRDVGNILPGYLPQAPPGDKASDTLPARLSLVGTAKGNDYNSPPLH